MRHLFKTMVNKKQEESLSKTWHVIIDKKKWKKCIKSESFLQFYLTVDKNRRKDLHMVRSVEFFWDFSSLFFENFQLLSRAKAANDPKKTVEVTVQQKGKQKTIQLEDLIAERDYTGAIAYLEVIIHLECFSLQRKIRRHSSADKVEKKWLISIFGWPMLLFMPEIINVQLMWVNDSLLSFISWDNCQTERDR